MCKDKTDATNEADKRNTDIQELVTHLARVLSIANSTGDELDPDLDICKVINDATDMLLKHDDNMEYIDAKDTVIDKLVKTLGYIENRESGDGLITATGILAQNALADVKEMER